MRSARRPANGYTARTSASAMCWPAALQALLEVSGEGGIAESGQAMRLLGSTQTRTDRRPGSARLSAARPVDAAR